MEIDEAIVEIARTAHPWHGGTPTTTDQTVFTTYIETLQFDTMKYELDHRSGLLKVDRPQQRSTLPPYPYGFIPRTCNGTRVANLSGVREGDGAPLDVFILSERMIASRGILADVRLVGGIPVLENEAADDKLIGVLAADGAMGDIRGLSSLPVELLDRIIHYLVSDDMLDAVSVGEVYDVPMALKVLHAAMDDYNEAFNK